MAPTLYDAAVRRLIGWTAGMVGIAALARLLARRGSHPTSPPTPLPPPSAPVPDPAAELRRKLSETLSETKTATEPAEDGVAGDGEPPEEKESIETRRARVHAKAQEAIQEMQEPLE